MKFLICLKIASGLSKEVYLGNVLKLFKIEIVLFGSSKLFSLICGFLLLKYSANGSTWGSLFGLPSGPPGGPDGPGGPGGPGGPPFPGGPPEEFPGGPLEKFPGKPPGKSPGGPLEGPPEKPPKGYPGGPLKEPPGKSPVKFSDLVFYHHCYQNLADWTYLYMYVLF